MRTRRTLGLAAAALVSLVACRGGGSNAGEAVGSINIDGSSTVYPITEAVAEEFQKEHRDVRVAAGYSGTGGGFSKFCRGEIEISGASRPIKPTEVDACAKAGIPYIELPVAYDGLAIVVNPKNTWVEHITVAELKRLWEPAAEGKITRWSQIRTGWPDREVHLFGPGVDSGTFDYFTEAVNGKEKASRGDYTSSEDDNVIVQGIAGDEGALGYVGLAYYQENQGKLKLVPVDDQKDDNGKGAIVPSPETVSGGTYRPLSRPLFIYVSQKAATRPEVKAFVDFYLAKAGDLVREVGYVQLAGREQPLVVQRFATQKTGTMYGKPGASNTALEQLLGGQ